MNQWQKVMSVVIACFLTGSSVLSKVLLARNAQTYARGHLSGKVDAIVSMQLSAAQRKEMLELELRNAQTLGFTELVRHIEAHLGLAVARSAQLESLIIQKDLLSDAFVQYSLQQVRAAAPYSDAIDVPGFAAVSEERERSILNRAIKATKNTELPPFYAKVQKIHEKVSAEVFSGRRKQSTIHVFIEAFITHMKAKYQVEASGMKEEIIFRVFDVLVDAQPDDIRHIDEVIGDFLDTFNGYVVDAHKVTREELAVEYFGWPDVLLSSSKLEKHTMLLLSYSMELVKRAVQTNATMKAQREQLTTKTSEAAEQLRSAGIKLDQAQVDQPVYVQNECAKYTNQVITMAGGADKLTEVDRAKVTQFTELSRQLNELTADYENVVRQQADAQSVRSAHEVYSQLPKHQQDMLAPPPSRGGAQGGSYGGMPGGMAGLPGMHKQLHDSNKSNKIMTVLVPLALTAVAVGGYHYAVKYAKGKTEEDIEGSKFAPVLRFLQKRDTPVQVGKDMLAKARKILGMKPKEPAEEAVSSSSTPPPATDTLPPSGDGQPEGISTQAAAAALLDAPPGHGDATPVAVPLTSDDADTASEDLLPMPPAAAGVVEPVQPVEVTVQGGGDAPAFAGVTGIAGGGAEEHPAPVVVGGDGDVTVVDGDNQEDAEVEAPVPPPAPSAVDEAPVVPVAAASSRVDVAAADEMPVAPEELPVDSAVVVDEDQQADPVAPVAPAVAQPASGYPAPKGKDPVPKKRFNKKRIRIKTKPKKESTEEADVYGRAIQMLKGGESIAKGDVHKALTSLNVGIGSRNQGVLLTKLSDLAKAKPALSNHIAWIRYLAEVSGAPAPASSS